MEEHKKIIGTSNTSFKGTDGTQIEGITLYITEHMDPKRGQGEAADRFFLSKAKLATLDFTPTPGQTVEIYYNKFGKVSTLRLVADANVTLNY